MTVRRGPKCVSNRGYHTYEIFFDDCRVPAQNILLDGNAFGRLISVYNAERLGSIARMLGSAQASFELAVAYAERNGIDYRVIAPKDPTRKNVSYSDNFRFNRQQPWTH